MMASDILIDDELKLKVFQLMSDHRELGFQNAVDWALETRELQKTIELLRYRLTRNASRFEDGPEGSRCLQKDKTE